MLPGVNLRGGRPGPGAPRRQSTGLRGGAPPPFRQSTLGLSGANLRAPRKSPPPFRQSIYPWALGSPAPISGLRGGAPLLSFSTINLPLGSPAPISGLRGGALFDSQSTPGLPGAFFFVRAPRQSPSPILFGNLPLGFSGLAGANLPGPVRQKPPGAPGRQSIGAWPNGRPGLPGLNLRGGRRQTRGPGAPIYRAPLGKSRPGFPGANLPGGRPPAGARGPGLPGAYHRAPLGQKLSGGPQRESSRAWPPGAPRR